MNKRKRKKISGKLTEMSCAVQSEYPPDCRCICFCCGQRFSVNDMQESDWLEEMDGGITALCPYCGQDTVLPDNGHIPQSWVTAVQKVEFGGQIMQGRAKDPETGKNRYDLAEIFIG